MLWLLKFALLASASAQIPSLGWCPDYQPMANFNMNKFLGTWYEAERYFTVSELGSRCVTTTYERTPEGRILVENEITNTLTGMKRLMVGTLQMIGREGEARVIVKYSSVPLPYDTELSVLDTDYDNYAVVWSCSGIGPVHTQNAWVLTRERLAPSTVMQSAYGVLDKFKLSRAFFVRTNQEDCNILPPPVEEQAGKNVPKVEVEAKHAETKVEAERGAEQIPPEISPLPKGGEPEKMSSAPEIMDTPERKTQTDAFKAPMPVPELIISEAEKKEEIKKQENKKDEVKSLEGKSR